MSRNINTLVPGIFTRVSAHLSSLVFCLCVLCAFCGPADHNESTSVTGQPQNGTHEDREKSQTVRSSRASQTGGKGNVQARPSPTLNPYPPIAVMPPGEDLGDLRTLLLERGIIGPKETALVDRHPDFIRLATAYCDENRVMLQSPPGVAAGYQVEIRRAVEGDGGLAPGSVATPRTKIVRFRVLRLGSEMDVPPGVFDGLLSPKFCIGGLAGTWAYQADDGSRLSIYIVGSDGAGFYGAKIVFSSSGFLGRVVLESDWAEVLPLI